MRPTSLPAFGPALVAAILLAGCAPEGPAAAPAGEAAAERPVPDHIWPPRVGERYPDLQLLNVDGDRISLASLQGKVILVEPIGMDCPACQGFAGGNQEQIGGFGGVRPQGGLPDAREMLERYAKVSLDDERLVYVQLLLYDMKRTGAPTLELAQRWARHFGLGGRPNEYVLVGEPYLIGRASFRMIPGFQLIDRDFVLRYDAGGHRPEHNLWKELLPAVASLLEEVDASAAGE